MSAELPTLATADRHIAWGFLVSSAPRTVQAIEALAASAVVCQTAGSPLDEGEQRLLIARAVATAGLAPACIEAIIASGNEHLLDVMDSDSDNEFEERTHTLDLGAEGKIVLKGKRREGVNEDRYDHAGYVMKLVSRPPGLPDDAQLPRLVDALSNVQLEAESAERLILLTAICGGPLPTAENAGSDERLWSVLVHVRPEARPILLAAIDATVKTVWDFEKLIQSGNPDLLPHVARMWAKLSSEYEQERYTRWLVTLPGDLVRGQLDQLLPDEASLSNKSTPTLLRTFSPLPLPLALRLLTAGRLSYAVAPFDAGSLTALEVALAQMSAGQILSQAPALRRIRVAAPAVFDQALAKQVARNDRTGAAWLRSGLPMDAGMKDAYEAAFLGDEPHRWVVGAALRLKDGRLTSGDFLERVPGLPATAQSDAALAASRSLPGKCADQANRLAAIMQTAPASDLQLWIGLAPPDPAIEAVLVKRLGEDAAMLQAVAIGLSVQLRSGVAGWLPLIDRLDRAAGRRLRPLVGLPAAP